MSKADASEELPWVTPARLEELQEGRPHDVGGQPLRHLAIELPRQVAGVEQVCAEPTNPFDGGFSLSAVSPRDGEILGDLGAPEARLVHSGRIDAEEEDAAVGLFVDHLLDLDAAFLDVEEQVAEAVAGYATVVDLDPLEDMRMVCDDEIGAGAQEGEDLLSARDGARP